MKIIEEANVSHLDDIVSMGLKLWPDNEADDLRKEFAAILQSDKDRIFVCKDNEKCIAFIHVSLRFDYVQGAISSPVGYVEGVYVQPEYRLQGISTGLLKKAENWAKERGCTQMASDIEMDNTGSYEFHIKSGFKEAGKIICFIKDI